MKKWFYYFEYIFTIIYLILYAGGIVVLILSGGASEGEAGGTTFDSGVLRAIYFVNYLFSFILLSVHWKKTLYYLSKNLHILSILILALFSSFWSAIPSGTQSNSIALIGTTLFGFYLAIRYTSRQRLFLFGWAFGLVLLLSFVFIFALPKYGIMGGIHAGAARGIFTHKNQFGKTLVICVMTFQMLVSQPGANRLLSLLGLASSFGFVILCRSTTALLSSIIIISIAPIYRILRLRYNLLFPTVSLVICLSVLVFIGVLNSLEGILNFFGEDLTLTGRTDLWKTSWSFIQQQFWWGHGYGGFWSTSRHLVEKAVRWKAPNSHNGFLDLWLDLGFVGFAILVSCYFTTLFRSLIVDRFNKVADSLWIPLFLNYYVLLNLAESYVIERNDIFWVLFVSSVVSTSINYERLGHQINRRSQPNAPKLLPQ
jgi:O-antigen ligase